jgi:hypothetical protein
VIFPYVNIMYFDQIHSLLFLILFFLLSCKLFFAFILLTANSGKNTQVYIVQLKMCVAYCCEGE